MRYKAYLFLNRGLNSSRLAHRADVRLFQRVGEHLADTMREDENVFELMNHDGLLAEFYEKCLGCPQAYHYLGKLVGQLTHRYQNMDILEIGLWNCPDQVIPY